jgi:hypothetical protein
MGVIEIINSDFMFITKNIMLRNVKIIVKNYQNFQFFLTESNFYSDHKLSSPLIEFYNQ